MVGRYAFANRQGEVVEFDDHAGWGTVAAADGERWFFHCTTIADGTRTIPIGTVVTFDVVAGNGGRWEAANLRRI